jgi:hypothetical protein
MTCLPAGIATFVSTHVFSFLFLINISGLFAVTSLCVPLDSITLSYLHVHILVFVGVFIIYDYYYCCCCGGGGGVTKSVKHRIFLDDVSCSDNQ